MLLCSVTSPRIASAILAKQSAGRYRSLIREYRVNGICWIELLIIGNGKYGFYMQRGRNKLESAKAPKQSPERSQQASWNQRKHQSSHSKKLIGKLKSAKSPKQSLKEADRQARISENAKAVNQRSTIGKLESAKTPKQSTEIAQQASRNRKSPQSSQPKKHDRQARISENAKAVNRNSPIGKPKQKKCCDITQL